MVKDLWARIQMGTSSDPVINSLGRVANSLSCFIEILICEMVILLTTSSKLLWKAIEIVAIIL